MRLSFFHDPRQALIVLTNTALVCLILAAIILLGSLVVLRRARRNFAKSEEELRQAEEDKRRAQEMKAVWENEKHRFSRPTLVMPEDYYVGYERSLNSTAPLLVLPP
jgi:beta-lactamase regulating signal transducer with metallopeptidase domain